MDQHVLLVLGRTTFLACPSINSRIECLQEGLRRCVQDCMPRIPEAPQLYKNRSRSPAAAAVGRADKCGQRTRDEEGSSKRARPPLTRPPARKKGPARNSNGAARGRRVKTSRSVLPHHHHHHVGLSPPFRSLRRVESIRLSHQTKETARLNERRTGLVRRGTNFRQ